jgi:hypothetical protein
VEALSRKLENRSAIALQRDRPFSRSRRFLRITRPRAAVEQWNDFQLLFTSFKEREREKENNKNAVAG